MPHDAGKKLLYASNLWYLGEGLLGPLLVVYAERVGGNILDLTYAWASYLVVSGVATVVVGKIAKTTRQQQMFAVAGYAINAILTFGYLLVSTPLQLLAIQIGLGLACAMSTPTWYALYSQCQQDVSTDSWGKAYGHSNIVTGVAFVVGGLIATTFSFTALFMVMGVIHVVATLYVLQITRMTPDLG